MIEGIHLQGWPIQINSVSEVMKNSVETAARIFCMHFAMCICFHFLLFFFSFPDGPAGRGFSGGGHSSGPSHFSGPGYYDEGYDGYGVHGGYGGPGERFGPKGGVSNIVGDLHIIIIIIKNPPVHQEDFFVCEFREVNYFCARRKMRRFSWVPSKSMGLDIYIE